MISLYGCFKNTFIFDVVHEYMTLFIKVLVLHVEFHLYFSKIRFKKKFSSTYKVHIYNVYFSFTESMTEVHTELHRS